MHIARVETLLDYAIRAGTVAFLFWIRERFGQQKAESSDGVLR